MDLKTMAVIFGTVFLAELGDKTQLATVLFASNRENSIVGVFLAASAALVSASAVAVAAGNLLAHAVNTRYLAMVAGIGFTVALFVSVAAFPTTGPVQDSVKMGALLSFGAAPLAIILGKVLGIRPLKLTTTSDGETAKAA